MLRLFIEISLLEIACTLHLLLLFIILLSHCFCQLHRVNWDLEIRVSDFGLSRSMAGKDYYRMGQVGRLPVKWMAPECLIDLVFNSNTDVVSSLYFRWFPCEAVSMCVIVLCWF